MPEKIYIIGAGGHAKVVISTLQAQGRTVYGLFDDDEKKWGAKVLGLPVLGGISLAAEYADQGSFILAIGDNRRREALAQRFARFSWETAIHPNAYVHPSVQVGAGTVVFAGAIIQPGARIGRHCIINTGATVDHDCRLGDYVHIAPGSHLAGGVIVGSQTMLGIGTSVIPGINIGEKVVVGAGSVVVSDVNSGSTVVGVPAKPIPGKGAQNEQQ